MNQLVDRLLIQVTSCGFFTGVKYVDGWLIASVCQQNSSSVNLRMNYENNRYATF